MLEQITLSIVTHNSQHIFSVLDNLKKELGTNANYSIYIYDNGSEASYVKKLETYGSFIKLKKSPKNNGFGYGHNQILRSVSTRYSVIFNPDVLVTKATLDCLLMRIKADETLAAVFPKVLNEDGTPQYLVRQKLDVFDYMLRFIPFKWVKKVFDQRLSRYECRELPDDEMSYIKMGSGCLMVIDTAKFQEIGGFDERFFMYFEDNDLCLRFGQAGYHLLYTPFETVIHVYEQGAHKNWQLFKIFLHSMSKFFNKWGWRFF